MLFAVQHKAADVKLSKMLNGCNGFSFRCSLYAEEAYLAFPPMEGYWLEMGKNSNPSRTNRTKTQGLPSVNKHSFCKYKKDK